MKTAGILVGILICAILPVRAAFTLPPDTDETAWPIQDSFHLSSAQLSGSWDESGLSLGSFVKGKGAWGSSTLPSVAGEKAVKGMQLFLKLKAEFLSNGKELPASGKGLPPHLLADGNPGDLTPVPEPSTWLMGAASVVLLLCFTWQVHSQGSGIIRVAQRE
jgi:hypothetical protein